jgi:hypothetical protein
MIDLTESSSRSCSRNSRHLPLAVMSSGLKENNNFLADCKPALRLYHATETSTFFYVVAAPN